MLGKIAWKNILYKPLNSALCIGLLLFGVGIISLLLLIQHHLEQKFEQDFQDIDLVIGAKGSPLQLVLSSIYHLDTPTGNIKLAEARSFMEHPLVEEATPLAYGDSYRSYRILGTTSDYLKKYDAQLAQGRGFTKSMEVSIGAEVAEKIGLQLGDKFEGNHGELPHGQAHEHHPYTVVGILERTNTVVDRLILTDLESVWQVHVDHTDNQPSIDPVQATELDFGRAFNNKRSEQAITADSMEVTAVLLKLKTKQAALDMPPLVNGQTNMQAVLPAFEVNRFFYLLGVGVTTIKLITGGIMLMAGFSMFFVLYSRLRDRRYELALMRTVGYRPRQLFGLLVLEGLFLAGLGYALGWILSRVGISLIRQQAQNDFDLHFDASWVQGEGWLLLITFLIGVLSALLPAWQAMRMDVSAILSES